VDNEIIPYLEMCIREGAQLQRGMNFRLNPYHSVVLMSVRKNAPYADRIEEDGTVIIYEGHNVPKNEDNPVPQNVDQPERTPKGTLTQNGKFKSAVQLFKENQQAAEIVRIYEKIRKGIWSYNGLFSLTDSWTEESSGRSVFKFRLESTQDRDEHETARQSDPPRRRLIPAAIKQAVYIRDGGKCVQCGATDELHFDHDVPYSKGGTSLSIDNVQLLCARHNLKKSDHIE
jgi:hypothetical protein